MFTNSNSNDNQYVIIYKLTLAVELMKKGHTVIATMPNPNRPNFTTWIFERSDEFIRDLEELKGGSRNGN